MIRVCFDLDLKVWRCQPKILSSLHHGYILVVMVEVEFVPFNTDLHMKELHEMHIEYMTWVINELDKTYQIDTQAMMGVSIQEVVDNSIGSFMSLKPPDGILLIAQVDGKIVGTGALKRLGDGLGEIKRMYNRPQFRGLGVGKQMLNRLLEAGREYGYTSFMLDTPKWAYAAQHIYRSVGFEEVEEYPESEIPTDFRQYWMFMKKKE